MNRARAVVSGALGVAALTGLGVALAAGLGLMVRVFEAVSGG